MISKMIAEHQKPGYVMADTADLRYADWMFSSFVPVARDDDKARRHGAFAEP